MAGQKEQLSQPDRETGTYTLEKFRANERKLQAVHDEIVAITINDGTVSPALKDRAKQLAAVEQELLDQAYVQAVPENKARDRRAWIPGYKYRNKAYTVAQTAGLISKALIMGYLDGVTSLNRSPLDQDLRNGARRAGEWYKNKRQSRKYRGRYD